MCTMAWGISGGGFWICFNRDEQRSRPEAGVPRIYSGRPFPVAYPGDPLGGGTWLAVSGAGFAVALMNQYSAGNDIPVAAESRGRIVTRLIQSESYAGAGKEISGMESLACYAPFYLCILSAEGGKQWSWNGYTLDLCGACPEFWTTSSHRPDHVCAWRMNQWRKSAAAAAPTLERARAVLRTRGDDPASGMTMDRDDARTVSQTVIEMGGRGMRMEYSRREPGGFGFEKPFVVQW